MKEKRVLYVSSEVIPYLPETEASSMSYFSPKMVNDRGGQIRIFMPRFGNINERRHQLHEVIRLSGMNLIINDLDMPLIIKVASIPKERMQVYFIDNEEYFKRKATLTDEDGNLFPDNDERAIFFAKGVIETVKKLNWAPDIIHVHGWMAGMLPLYLKNYYGNDPLFEDSKIVTSVYNQSFDGSLDNEMIDKLRFDALDEEALEFLEEPTYDNIMKTSLKYSDAIIKGSEELSPEIESFVNSLDRPVLEYHAPDSFADAYENFYLNDVLTEEKEEA
ncbi:similar to glycogen synthase [Nonlabens tegetincola]|uniref:starch synthase n=1 Tax=Nonlabens tegetincola TaxID=323273 RepID=A0A090PY43_9FLAO|nr:MULTISPECIES: glycogen/starch synthase [Nonlabens]ALM20962.1 glycogen synthase [Nonlabens sp. MIC269]ARN72314.1 glycogen synthase [Nonlabens tegetincola]PQJ20068.1 glycogen synthase [Nonlabens tegetincola]GAK95774.1 similar to glycogen synthase [Nonlabens tegetincola]